MLQLSPQDPASAAGLTPPRGLRILQILPHYHPAVRYGGPIRSVHALAKSLVERGNEVHVFTSSMDGRADLPIPAGGTVMLDGVRVHYFPVRLLRRLCWCPAMLAALRAEAGGFDVMHLHSMFQWPTYAAARMGASLGLPYLVAPRGMLGRAVIRAKSRWVKTAWIRLVERQTLDHAGGLHVTTALEAAEVRALGLRLPKIFCVPNSVTWPARHTPLGDGPFANLPSPYVLFLSRLDPKKGLDRLIDAWRWVEGATLVIAGNDEDGYRVELERLAARHGVRNRIVFAGPVSDEHKWALYENALLFTLPSYSENFGNVVAEAMAMGCPVVVTPEVGLASLVAESGCGLVTDGAPRALAQTLNELLMDPDRRRRMAERGPAAARSHLSADSVGARMEAIYRRVCRRPSSVLGSAA